MIPIGSDRIAQIVARLAFNPILTGQLRFTSYGYSASNQDIGTGIDAPVLLAIRLGIGNTMHMEALSNHADIRRVLSYVQSRQTAPMQKRDRSTMQREVGGSQGGPCSQIIWKLFLHYETDKALATQHKANPFLYIY